MSFQDWIKKLDHSEALLLDDDVLDGSELKVKSLERAMKPPTDLPLTSYENWMEQKSTKAPRLSPDTGGDLKVRFDVNVKEKRYFKDDVPKKSGERIRSRFQFTSRHVDNTLHYSWTHKQL